MTFSAVTLLRVAAACGLIGLGQCQSSSVALWPTHTYKTQPTFTPPSLAINKTAGEPLGSGYLFFDPAGRPPLDNAPLIMTDENHLIYHGSTGLAFNFGVQQYQGKPVLVYWNGTLFQEPVGRGNGAVNILNSSYQVIATVTLPGNFLELTPGATFPSNIDLHELNITPKGTLLVTANNVTTTDLTSVGGPKVGWVVDSQIYEIDIATNEVLFEWSALDHLDAIPLTSSVYPYGSEGFSGVNQSVAWGYSHINSVALYEDGYIMSFRYLCAAIAIDGKGNVKWHLQGQTGGDFTLGTDTNFCYQHDIRPHHVTNNNLVITMHDNANSPINIANSTTPTSGLVLNVDVAKKAVTLNQRFENPAHPIFSTAQGNFQRLPNKNVFMGHGITPFFEEFAPSGAIAMTVQFEFNIQGDGLSYRAFRQPWVGCPTTPPVAFTEIENGELAVYMSWNGATEYGSWIIYGGSIASDLSIIQKVQRTGFETRATVNSTINYVQVQAVPSKGGWGKCGNGGSSRSIVSAAA